jgi:glycerophosphoryl diester phosphodiesterase
MLPIRCHRVLGALNLVVSVACVSRSASTQATPEALPSKIPVVIGHRGASGYAPEHTFVSYDLALRMGADYIEPDLQMTKDGVLVAMHDPTLDRTARGASGDCTGPVAEKTLAQIRRCDVGSWFNARYPERARAEYVGATIPTLEEIFARYGLRARYYVETKNPEIAPGMEEALVALLDRFALRVPAAKRRQVLIQSFSPASLMHLHGIDSTLPLIQLLEARELSTTSKRELLQRVATYAIGIGPDMAAVDSSLVREAHALGLIVHPYTVNDEADLERLTRLGVDGMFTNFPDRLIAIRDRRTAPNEKR